MKTCDVHGAVRPPERVPVEGESVGGAVGDAESERGIVLHTCGLDDGGEPEEEDERSQHVGDGHLQKVAKNKLKKNAVYINKFE